MRIVIVRPDQFTQVWNALRPMDRVTLDLPCNHALLRSLNTLLVEDTGLELVSLRGFDGPITLQTLTFIRDPEAHFKVTVMDDGQGLAYAAVEPDSPDSSDSEPTL